MPDGFATSPQGIIPVAAVADWLAVQTQADSVSIEPLILLPGGAVQQNWALNMNFAEGRLPGHHRLVLRANFQTPLPASRSKAEEFAIIRAVVAAGVTAPAPLWLCEDTEIIGQPFFVMRRAAGDATARTLVSEAAAAGFGPDLADRLARELALIHSLTPGAEGLNCLTAPPESSALALVAEYRNWLSMLCVESGILAATLDWLESHAPPRSRTSLLHRDFRTGNFLVDRERLTAVLDWDFAGWGDPHEDIGWFCAACWRAGRDDFEVGGLTTRDAFYNAYEAAGGQTVDPDAVSYWEIMAHTRWALIARRKSVV